MGISDFLSRIDNGSEVAGGNKNETVESTVLRSRMLKTNSSSSFHESF